jgi:hypothetical protein
MKERTALPVGRTGTCIPVCGTLLAYWAVVKQRIEPSDLTSVGLILWHLSSRDHSSDLWCLVFEFSDGFYLVVDDNPEGFEPPRINERQRDIQALVHRAEELKRSLVRWGWTELDDE